MRIARSNAPRAYENARDRCNHLLALRVVAIGCCFHDCKLMIGISLSNASGRWIAEDTEIKEHRKFIESAVILKKVIWTCKWEISRKMMHGLSMGVCTRALGTPLAWKELADMSYRIVSFLYKNIIAECKNWGREKGTEEKMEKRSIEG